MSDITLTAAVRDSLLSLQNTTKLIESTQGRLSTGLKVAGPTDDPVNYFQAKSLDDRAADFNTKKDGIGQGVSTVSAALDGVKAIEALVKQLQGIANSMKSADSSSMVDLLQQFNDLRTQINNSATDSTYQGTNLIAGVGQKLTVEFSEKTASRVQIDSVDLTNGTAGLNVYEAVAYTGGFYANYGSAAATSGSNLTATSVTLTWQGAKATYSAGTTVSFTYGTGTLSLNIADTQTFSTRDALTVTLGAQSAQNSGIYTTGTTTLNFAADAAGTQNTQALYGSYSMTTAGQDSLALSAGGMMTMTWTGPTATYSAGSSITLGTGAGNFTGGALTVVTGGGTTNYSFVNGAVLTIAVHTAGATSGTNTLQFNIAGATAQSGLAAAETMAVSLKQSASATNAANLTLSWEGLSSTFASGSSLTFAYGSNTLTVNFQCSYVITAGSNVTVHLASATTYANASGAFVNIGTAGLANVSATTNTFNNATYVGTTGVAAGEVKTNYVNAGDTDAINAVLADLAAALTTLRTKSQGLGTNVALLRTRLDFTDIYVKELQKGAAKLTVADINEEGANLLALQTRQQLGTNSLRFAGQADQAVLSLFR